MDENGVKSVKVKLDGRDSEVWTVELYMEGVHAFCGATQLVLDVVECSEKRKSEGGGPIQRT